MKKLYYTNRIKASWMAEEFNVNFKSGRGENLYFDGGDFRVEKHCGTYGGTHYHIHPDSLPIFEPKEGDYVDDGNTYIGKVKRIIFNDLELEDLGIIEDWKKNNATIIQRDNKAFFTPEVEA